MGNEDDFSTLVKMSIRLNPTIEELIPTSWPILASSMKLNKL
jgi:hypothetical protein